jgi:aspartyl-tRNA(Asn)/glutamyl-tRNA(Gln) amidotransferase subunit C
MERERSLEARAEVERTARLARLEIRPADVALHARHFARILAAFESLAAVDCTGVEPLTGPTELVDVLRADVERASLPVERALANAPERAGDFYSVPKTVGGGGGEG